jgi:arylsulfatase A-like enzyme
MTAWPSVSHKHSRNQRTPLGRARVFEPEPGAAATKAQHYGHHGRCIGLVQVRIYHRGWAHGETLSIDRIGQDGAVFTDYYAMQSCTSGRNAFFTGMYPLRTGMIPPQLPGSPSYLRPGTPAVAKFLYDLGYTTREFGKNHLGDHTAACRQRTASRSIGAISITSTRWRRLASPKSTSTRRRKG